MPTSTHPELKDFAVRTLHGRLVAIVEALDLEAATERVPFLRAMRYLDCAEGILHISEQYHDVSVAPWFPDAWFRQVEAGGAVPIIGNTPRRVSHCRRALASPSFRATAAARRNGTLK